MPRMNRDEALPDDWNPMQDEYDNGAVDCLQYDKLYVTNIPQKLDEGGVENTFKVYGPVKKTFLNMEPQKRYAMVTFADAIDAERAIHGLNKKAPLNLRVEYAKNKEWHNQKRDKEYGSGKQRNNKAGRDAKPAQNTTRNPIADDGRRQDDRGSVSSGGRRSNGVGRQDWVTNNSFSNDGDEYYGEYFSGDEDYGLDDLELATDEDGLELSTGAPVERLLKELTETRVQLVRAQMREKAVKLGLNAASGRKSLPAGLSKGCFMTSSGRIVRQVSTVADSELPRRESHKQVNVEDVEENDFEQVPELREHVCVCCGRRGELECGACGTTYCSSGCQRKDWTVRHASVCHNLANSTANLARASARVTFQQQRQPRKSAVVSPEASEKATNNASQDGHRRQGPKRFANSNMQAHRQRNDDGNKSRQPRPNSRNRRDDRPSGSTTFRNQQQQDVDADFYSGGKKGAKSAQFDGKLNPVPIRRPREKAVHNDGEDWDADQGRQTTDSAIASDTKSKDVTKPTSTPTRMPRTDKTKEVVNAPSVIETKKVDLLRPDGFVAIHASPGTVLTLSVEADGATCDVPASCGQAVCVAVAEQFAAQFEALCGDDFIAACEKSEVCSPTPGSYVALRDALDGAWYRARILTENRAALVDAARIANVARDDANVVRRLPEGFLRAPEFCCAVGAAGDVGLKVGESYECVVNDISSDGVCSGTLRSLVHAGGGDLGPITLRRWSCRADDDLETAKQASTPVQATTPAKPAQAKVTQTKEAVTEAKANLSHAKQITTDALTIDAILARPAVSNESKVLLVEYTDLNHVFVRRADEESKLRFDSLVQDVALYGLDAPPLTEPQPVGQVVIAQFTDDNYYRAIITKRSRVEQSKYMLEYIEYGNTEISNLDKLRACPDELSLETRPALLSRVSLSDVTSNDDGKVVEFTKECTRYLGQLKDKEAELVLTLKDVSSKGAVGCEVSLCVERSKECVNEKLRHMLMPQWETMEVNGQDVIESPVLMWFDMKIAVLPKGSCRLQVLDAATLLAGAISACSAEEDWRRGIMDLSEQLEKYASSKVGSASYLPRHNELCVIKSEDGKWHRAACMEQPGGAGTTHITVMHVDSGRVENVAVGDVRKMLPEIANRRPAMAAYCVIEGYPEEPSNELMARTRELLGVTDASPTGIVVDCSSTNQTSAGEYTIALPTLLATLKAEGLLEH